MEENLQNIYDSHYKEMVEGHQRTAYDLHYKEMVEGHLRLALQNIYKLPLLHIPSRPQESITKR